MSFTNISGLTKSTLGSVFLKEKKIIKYVIYPKGQTSNNAFVFEVTI